MLYEINLRISLRRISFADFNLHHMLLFKPDCLIIFHVTLLYIRKLSGNSKKYSLERKILCNVFILGSTT